MTENREIYLHENVLPNAVSSGSFGSDMSFVRCELDSKSEGVDQYASSVIFLDAILAESAGAKDETERKFPLVIKFQPQMLNVREIMNSDVQFHNEVAMYSEILPKLNTKNDIVSSLFPKYYYGLATLGSEPEKDVIVLEDLKGKGFKLTEERVFLDYDHIVLTLKALGEFHALSYVTKQKDPGLFNDVKSKLKEHLWSRKDAGNSQGSIIQICAARGVNPLYEKDPTNEILNKMKTTFEKDMTQFMINLVKPEEPTAVICHGDFLRNNILFSYDDITKRPKSVRFFDLQTSRYASPAIDLTLLLWMNTSYELRSKHWKDFIDIYYDSVEKTAKSLDCTDYPTFGQLNDDLRRKGVYGYMHSSYFLPMSVSEVPPDIEYLSTASPEEMGRYMAEASGEYGTRLLTEIVKHLVEFKYFDTSS